MSVLFELWRVLPNLKTRCDASIQKTITSLTFEQLITTQDGVSTSRALVNVIINQQIGQQISVSLEYSFYCQRAHPPQVDTISEVLQQRCGSFCSTDDVLLYKV